MKNLTPSRRRPFLPRRRRSDDPAQCRYEDAWGSRDAGPPPGTEDRRRMPRAADRRKGAVVMVAPMFGALGAYLFFRRRRA